VTSLAAGDLSCIIGKRIIRSQSVQALGPGSSDPAALLVAASRYCSEQDARCETALEAIRSHSADGKQSQPPRTTSSTAGLESVHRGDEAMKEAIEDCVEAAGWVWRMNGQQDLLRAAIYGRGNAATLVDAALIPQCALHCRALNSLRIASGVRPLEGTMSMHGSCVNRLLGGVIILFY
jgi:hypothetical protein